MFEREPFPIVAASSLSAIAGSHTLRCDAKQAEKRFLDMGSALSGLECFLLNELLPRPLSRGSQPKYLDGREGALVVNTLSIRNLRIDEERCRHIAEETYEALPEEKKLKPNDVLLTMDGGTSIGKPVLFDLGGEWTVDSHVAILRPAGVSPKALVYLLASPLGQMQFLKAESGASGQTTVTEEDLRRFMFPRKALEDLESLAARLDAELWGIQDEMKNLQNEERLAWERFSQAIMKR